jgi:hypothetical protein
MAVTPALPEATLVGVLSAQLKCPRPRSAGSGLRRIVAFILVGGHVVDAVRRDLAERLVFEVVNLHAQRLALGPIVRGGVLEIADQVLLLRVDGHDRLSASLRRKNGRVDVLELRVPIGMAGAFLGLTIALARKAELPQLRANRIDPHREAHRR